MNNRFEKKPVQPIELPEAEEEMVIERAERTIPERIPAASEAGERIKRLDARIKELEEKIAPEAGAAARREQNDIWTEIKALKAAREAVEAEERRKRLPKEPGEQKAA